MSSKAEELVARLNTSQNNVFRSRQQLDTIREEMSWNEQELDAWLVGCARRGRGRRKEDIASSQKRFFFTSESIFFFSHPNL